MTSPPPSRCRDKRYRSDTHAILFTWVSRKARSVSQSPAYAWEARSTVAQRLGGHIVTGDIMGASHRSRIVGLLALLAFVGASAGCGDNIAAFRPSPGDGGTLDGDSSVTDGDVQPDVVDAETGAEHDATSPDATDVALEARTDTPGDLATDAPIDLATDLAADGPTDLATDGPTDLPTDLPTDVPTDLATDVGSGDADGNPDGDIVECIISSPTITVTHPMLNGVPVAQGGDRVSAAGTPYAVAFGVTTSVPDNQTVVLTVVDEATPTLVTTYTASVSNGRANFAGVTLPVDGVYDVAARCLDKDGDVGLAGPQPYTVDTTPPDFTVTSPQSGEVIPPSGLTNGTFPVCGGTDSTDAVDLSPALGPRSMNACFAAGGSPECFPVPSSQTSGCLPVICPGDAPFNVVVTLGDIAGNITTVTVGNVSCYSTLPSVLIVAPVSDGPAFNDPSKHLLSSTAPQAFRDTDAAPGAQTNVVACANRAGTIKLFAGHKGDQTLPAISAQLVTRTAVAADNCPAGLLYAVTFAGMTLPESIQAADTSLVTPTELRADFVDLSATKNSSPLVDLWVDSVAPVLLIAAPPDICNSYHQSNDVYISTETVTSTAPNIALTLTNSVSTENYDSTTFTSLTFPQVVFTQGQNLLQGSARDDAGNVSLLQPNPCVVTVGTGPTP
jgi:hypothetical protein